MALSAAQQHELQTQLQQAIVACNERCLYFAAKWSAELLNSFATSNDTQDHDTDTDIDDDLSAPSPPQPSSTDRRECKLEAKELPRYLLAKSFFDCREFDRCAAVFLPSQMPHSTPAFQTATPTKFGSSVLANPPLRSSARSKVTVQTTPLPKRLSQKSLFLVLYARYMSGEKRKIEDSETILGPADGPSLPNKELSGVLANLDEYFSARGGIESTTRSQGYLEYLYGMLLLKSKSEPLAQQWLVRSVSLNPYNWSAWLELASIVGSTEDLAIVNQQLPQTLMSFFFHIHCSQELYKATPEVLQSLQQMQSFFPSSAFLQQQAALLHYHAHDYETAMQIFDTLLKDHPNRLDGMDVYSNLLYVLQHRPKLATLASLASATDKFRPETNCILGNYYGLISEHEKAVLHFRRALSLDRNFQGAWTLMGHEYIELKNTQAAIESYRHAVDTNRKDHRAWYGLGQGYEMLECHSYSLFYYQRAAALCPGDPKMWAAVGNAFGKCGKIPNAVQAYKRALVVGSQMDSTSSFGSSASADPLAHTIGGVLDPQILYEIALLYERANNYDEAAAFMELTLAQEEGEVDPASSSHRDDPDSQHGTSGGVGVTQTTSRARLWLARWCYSCGDWQRTMELANELCQDGVEVEDAKGLVRDVRARLGMEEEDGEMGENVDVE